MDSPIYLNQQDLTCIKGDTFGIYQFRIDAVDQAGQPVLDAFDNILVESKIVKGNGTVIDEDLVIEYQVVDQTLVIDISQVKEITVDYPIGTYAWYLAIVFEDGVRRTFYKGDLVVSKKEI